jgi:hypothetical protein
MRRSEFIKYLRQIESMRDARLELLIDRLTMRPRPAWNHLLPGWTGTDIDLGKFDRRFSLIGRPIVAVCSGEDPEIAVAPAVIERSIAHNLSGAMTGSLQNEFWNSKPMRTYSSRAGGRSGLKFNEELSETIRLLGLRTWPSAKPAWCLNCKATPEVEALGDVDVLAISNNGRQIWVIEAKDLKLCRTLGETTRRLSEYRGETDSHGKPDKLLRHLRRVEYLQMHAVGMQRFFKLESVPNVHGIVIVSAPQPMEKFRPHSSRDARVLILDDIEVVPWLDGWVNC